MTIKDNYVNLTGHAKTQEKEREENRIMMKRKFKSTLCILLTLVLTVTVAMASPLTAEAKKKSKKAKAPKTATYTIADNKVKTLKISKGKLILKSNGKVIKCTTSKKTTKVSKISYKVSGKCKYVVGGMPVSTFKPVLYKVNKRNKYDILVITVKKNKVTKISVDSSDMGGLEDMFEQIFGHYW